jgi:GH15 family glucan-1,4-alpha-glucosidase
MWVALDRGLRLADKRCLPCPNRYIWLKCRDTIYETIMERCWNEEMQAFGQSFESTDVLDSAVLIMPLVFFISANDPRFLSTMKRLMLPPEKGGLVSNGLVFRCMFELTLSEC